MGHKMKHLTLSFPHYDQTLEGVDTRLLPHNLLYRVEKATDSIEYPPTTLLTKRQVDELCAATGWNITIVKKKGEDGR